MPAAVVRHHHMSTSAAHNDQVTLFVDNGVSGQVLADGITAADLTEIGVTGSVRQRSVMAALAKVNQAT